MRNALQAALDAFQGLGRGRSQTPSRIIVGLGNPGGEYAKTRHNLGFWCVDRLANDHSIAISRGHRSALVGEGAIEGHRVVLAKPRTFVNRSGQAVAYLLVRYRVSPQELLVIHDDMDLPLGRMRLRPTGSAGGHNGIQSIIDAVGTQGFPRLRVGIGRPPGRTDPVDYVLGTMSAEERETADEVVERAAKAVSRVIADGIDVAMDRFN